MQMADNIAERARALATERMPEESARLAGEAEQLAAACRRPTRRSATPIAPRRRKIYLQVGSTSPSPKHEPGGWGTPMDLNDTTAQAVLNAGVPGPNGKQIYGLHDGRIYAA